MTNWQPIETAPQRGAILIWVPENRCIYEASWTDVGWCIFGGDWCGHIQSATHWMPLPEPPDSDAEEALADD